MALPPSWIEKFVQQLSLCLLPSGTPAPLGCHYHFEMGCWEIAIFPSMKKKNEAESYAPTFRPTPFSFDIQQALPLFEEVQHLDWIAMPVSAENEAGAHLLLEGIVNDLPVLIRICAEVPKRFQHDQDLIVQEK